MYKANGKFTFYSNVMAQQFLFIKTKLFNDAVFYGVSEKCFTVKGTPFRNRKMKHAKSKPLNNKLSQCNLSSKFAEKDDQKCKMPTSLIWTVFEDTSDFSWCNIQSSLSDR